MTDDDCVGEKRMRERHRGAQTQQRNRTRAPRPTLNCSACSPLSKYASLDLARRPPFLFFLLPRFSKHFGREARTRRRDKSLGSIFALGVIKRRERERELPLDDGAQFSSRFNSLFSHHPFVLGWLDREGWRVYVVLKDARVLSVMKWAGRF